MASAGDREAGIKGETDRGIDCVKHPASLRNERVDRRHFSFKEAGEVVTRRRVEGKDRGSPARSLNPPPSHNSTTFLTCLKQHPRVR
jgi:hypothetical protein